MSAPRRRFRCAMSIAAVVACASSSAWADMTKEQCIDANGKAQELRRAERLSAASEQLRQCANPACPAMVRDDCARRLDELEKAQPSLVFDVKDAAGADLIDVRVRDDGQPLLDHLDGKPVNVDPGAHVFVIEVAGKPPVTERLLIREGEAGRREHVVMGNAETTPPPVPVTPVSPAAPVSQPAPPAPPPSSEPVAVAPAPPAAPPESSGLGTQRVIGLSMGGVGLVGLGLGTAFGLMASSAWNNAKTACGGSVSQCTNVSSGTAYHGTAVTDGTISTVGFVAGGALVAAGVVLVLTGGHSASPTTGFVLTPSVGSSFGGLSMSGAF